MLLSKDLRCSYQICGHRTLKIKKIYVTDLDDNKYIDMICAVGTCILGYANNKIDKDIKNNWDGIMSTLNCPEEVQLTDKLLKYTNGLTKPNIVGLG